MRIVIPGEPIAKTRPRFSRRGGFVTTYDSQSKLKAALKGSLNIFVNLELPDNFEDYFKLPLRVTFSYRMPIIKSDTEAIKNAKEWGLKLPSHKPDIDNLVKMTADLCNGILWRDDAQIVELTASQIYSKNPCTIIEINTISEVKMAVEHEKVFKLFSPQDVELMSADAERIYMSIPPVPLHDSELFQKQMAASAELLIDFANEWADKLKKIKTIKIKENANKLVRNI